MNPSTQTVSICGKTYQSREAYDICNGCVGYKLGRATDLSMKLPDCVADGKVDSIIWVDVQHG